MIARPGDTIVEFGAGGGHLGLVLAHVLPACTVVLLDRKVLSIARYHLPHSLSSSLLSPPLFSSPPYSYHTPIESPFSPHLRFIASFSEFPCAMCCPCVSCSPEAHEQGDAEGRDAGCQERAGSSWGCLRVRRATQYRGSLTPIVHFYVESRIECHGGR